MSMKDFAIRFSGIVWQREKDDLSMIMSVLKGKRRVYDGKIRQSGSEEYLSKLVEINEAEFRNKMNQEEHEEHVKRKILDSGWVRDGMVISRSEKDVAENQESHR